MLIPNTTVKIISVGCNDINNKVFNGNLTYQPINNIRAVKQQFSNERPALVILCISDEVHESLSIKVTEYIRDGLLNLDTRILVIYEPDYILDELKWMSSLQVNGCLPALASKQTFNLAMINREVETFLYIDNSQRQHKAETEMLMCISRFSRNNEPLLALLNVFSSSLSALCYSMCNIHVQIMPNNQGAIDYCDIDTEVFIESLNEFLTLPNLPNFLVNALEEKQAQINLLPDELNLTALESALNQKVGSYLTFPVIAYNKPLYLLVYLISEEHMDKVTMRQINIINKASEQLTILLERRQAESSLKKQYNRLQTTLVDLKTAKKELEHNEKMACIGQMAAGIAHEINNPLAYVMSNFSCMDDYIDSIMQLQALQSEFLQSIDISENNKISELKNNITKFEEDQDIAFVLQDIRAVISDSHNGLKRVKNIITDLKSFTYSQSTNLEVCDLTKVINDTLKVLSYDITQDISIEQQISDVPEFMAHNGLMQQVLTNLIKNAGQALTEAKTPSAKIIIKAEYQEDVITISIKDNGPGIDDDAKNKIFEPFYTTKSVGEGTGLGLSVTFNIIKKLGGLISLNSQRDEFTEFILTFSTKS